MADHDRLTEQLRRLGERPVERDLAGHHLTAILLSPRRASGSRFSKVTVAAAFAAGLILGGTSLASAGVLGATAQRTVADTVDGVGIDLPGGTPRSTEGCGGEEVRNHGQFVSGGGDPHSECGKPLVSGKDGVEGAKVPGTNAGLSPCRPPWAGKGNRDLKTPEAVAAHHAACGDEDEAAEQPEQKSPAAGQAKAKEKDKANDKANDKAKESPSEVPSTEPPVTPADDDAATPETPDPDPAPAPADGEDKGLDEGAKSGAGESGSDENGAPADLPPSGE